MILQALNQGYSRFAQQVDAAGKPRVPPYGYSCEYVGFALIIDKNGALIDIERIPGKELDVPSDPTLTRTSSIKPMFLWDKSAYVLGLAAEFKTRTTDEHAAFKRRQKDLIADCDDHALRALLRFLDGWTPDVQRLPRHREDLIGSNVVFRFKDDDSYVHERPAARRVWAAFLATKAVNDGRCLITGHRSRIALTHPTIGGVRGAQTSGATIVSFNQQSFRSYGKEQGNNAPVSEAAAFAYTTMLNDFLRKGSRHKIQIGDATTVYWAEADSPQVAEVTELVFAWMSEPASVDVPDTSAVQRLRKYVMDHVVAGLPLDNPGLHLDERARFFILGLSPNAARLSVRFWEATTLGALCSAFYQHWADLRIDGPVTRRPPATWQLLSRTAPARRNHQGVLSYDAKQIAPNLAGAMMRSILTGRVYPRSILASVIMRFRTDRKIDGLRIALIKACLVRDMRRSNPNLSMDAYVSLNRNDPDLAYRLGRLFALFEKAQRAVVEGNTSTMCDRYYGAASATPQRMFALLHKNTEKHLASLRKGRGAKWVQNPCATGEWLDDQIGEIYGDIGCAIPSCLALEAQCRFAIGYYHERYAKHDDVPDDLRILTLELDEVALFNTD
jgi:CRISPR-associated protein Csd1